jgi:hypothetical protein
MLPNQGNRGTVGSANGVTELGRLGRELAGTCMELGDGVVQKRFDPFLLVVIGGRQQIAEASQGFPESTGRTTIAQDAGRSYLDFLAQNPNFSPTEFFSILGAPISVSIRPSRTHAALN